MALHSEDCLGISAFAGELEMGVLIRDIQEIIEPVQPLFIPVTDPFFSGLISIRGSIIPVLSLRSVFHVSKQSFSNKDNKYVVCVSGSEKIAISVDAVGDPFRFAPEDLNEVTEKTDELMFKLLPKSVQLDKKRLPMLSIPDLIQYGTRLNTKKREEAGYIS
ncbi:chemotaxis protein CheW [Sporolactobacillus sp. CPB3-1]|uniref:Chemotaxis protein CheW n=1 Tax=Sporolactobacillus mangiferae TaxID=2940498 RepID=A0ABT0MBE1_9BACL|nr:chemotaxis protein CheW [Sporolactobacillus mangiferae]MCL1632191.1 chemotaxis protein CheW [Sporolactobacillus mangiferae]